MVCLVWLGIIWLNLQSEMSGKTKWHCSCSTNGLWIQDPVAGWYTVSDCSVWFEGWIWCGWAQSDSSGEDHMNGPWMLDSHLHHVLGNKGGPQSWIHLLVWLGIVWLFCAVEITLQFSEILIRQLSAIQLVWLGLVWLCANKIALLRRYFDPCLTHWEQKLYFSAESCWVLCGCGWAFSDSSVEMALCSGSTCPWTVIWLGTVWLSCVIKLTLHLCICVLDPLAHCYMVSMVGYRLTFLCD